MKYLSVCSGIEAATVAWHPLGWTPVAFSEIEAFPSTLLDYHYPDTPNLGDMERFHEWPESTVDVLVGGTPCQSFSVAGLRRGLDDPRGNLALVYLAIAERYRPEWLVWENVPGVLSANGGRAFGAFLGGLEKLGYGWAYRTLDAQYFGLAQRRRRVFVVASAGGWGCAGSVLFDQLVPFNDPRGKAGMDGVCDERSWLLDGEGNPASAVQLDNSRYLTPRECERLQGFPDDYSLVNYKGKPATDTARYKALGNSMAVPVVRWIGERMDKSGSCEGDEYAR